MTVLVTGGSASGKSEFAENLAGRICKGKLLYIATMADSGAESAARIARHRAMRAGKGFETAEVPHSVGNLVSEVGPRDTLLLEDLPNLLANHIWMLGDTDPVKTILGELELLAARADNLVIVTGEIFSDGTLYDPETTKYLLLLGELGRRLAEHAQQVVEVVYTLPVYHKNIIDRESDKR